MSACLRKHSSTAGPGGQGRAGARSAGSADGSAAPAHLLALVGCLAHHAVLEGHRQVSATCQLAYQRQLHPRQLHRSLC